MSDWKVRELERRWRQFGSVDDEAALLLERVRAGELRSLDLRIAAYANDPAAILACPGLGLDDFLDLLVQVPWFSRIGQPHPRDAEVVRARTWDDWPGPEGVDALTQGTAYDGSGLLFQQAVLPPGAEDPLLEAVWTRVDATVREVAARQVDGYDPDEDAWHPQNACVWGAGFYSAILGCHLQLGSSPPSAAVTAWRWYAEGHWPCSYDPTRRDLVVL